MAQLITKEKVEKIARLSHIDLSETEIINAMKHLDAVLSYAARVQEIAKDVDVPSYAPSFAESFGGHGKAMEGRPSLKNCNVEREDIVIPTDAQAILAQAPEREGDFFVVPVIIEGQ